MCFLHWHQNDSSESRVESFPPWVGSSVAPHSYVKKVWVYPPPFRAFQYLPSLSCLALQGCLSPSCSAPSLQVGALLWELTGIACWLLHLCLDSCLFSPAPLSCSWSSWPVFLLSFPWCTPVLEGVFTCISPFRKPLRPSCFSLEYS